MLYNQAMASCSWDQAWACFQAMRMAGVQPNTRSYNAVRPLYGAMQHTIFPQSCSKIAWEPALTRTCTQAVPW